MPSPCTASAGSGPKDLIVPEVVPRFQFVTLLRGNRRTKAQQLAYNHKLILTALELGDKEGKSPFSLSYTYSFQ